MGCGATTDITAQAPQQPTPQQEVQAWVNALPSVYQAQATYAPEVMQSQYNAMNSIYPTLTQAPENLANIASQYINPQNGVPDWMKQQYQSNMNAQLGNNAAAGIGADYMSRGLLQQNQNYAQYYQSMLGNLANQQPLATTQNTNYMSGFTPGTVMSGMNQTYGTAGNIYGSQLGYNEAQNQNMLNLIGAGVGAVSNGFGSYYGNGGAGANAAMASGG